MRYLITIDCEPNYLQCAVHDLNEILTGEPVAFGAKIEIPLFDGNSDDFTMASFIIQETT